MRTLDSRERDKGKLSRNARAKAEAQAWLRNAFSEFVRQEGVRLAPKYSTRASAEAMGRVRDMAAALGRPQLTKREEDSIGNYWWGMRTSVLSQWRRGASSRRATRAGYRSRSGSGSGSGSRSRSRSGSGSRSRSRSGSGSRSRSGSGSRSRSGSGSRSRSKVPRRRRPRTWVQKAFSKNKGALHRALRVPEGKKIPVKKLRWAVRQGGKLAKRAQLVLNMRAARMRRGMRG